MDSKFTAREGTITFRGFKTWYRRVSATESVQGAVTLVCLHGGPGMPSDYLEPLDKLVRPRRDVLRYDQLGCGNSDQPRDTSLWTIDLFLDELRTLRQQLGLDEIHLLGHSWGGILAMEYALTRPAGLKSLVLSNTAASIPQFLSEVRRLIAELPAGIRDAIRDNEAVGTTDTPAYQEAVMAFYRRHFCLTDPWPDHMARTMEKCAANPEVYQTMWGPSEFHAIGPLKDWNIVDRLAEIRVPTLVVCGEHDEITSECTDVLRRGIAGARQVVLQQSAHMALIDREDAYLREVDSFLATVETQR